MSDDIEGRLRDALRRAALPGAPESTRAYLEQLREQPPPNRRRLGSRSWLLLVPAAVVLLGVVALAGGSTPTPVLVPSPSPTPTAEAFPTTVDGLPVLTVSQLLADRASGMAQGGPYVLSGYWTDRWVTISCGGEISGLITTFDPIKGGNTYVPPGDLEIACGDGMWGITERDEEILSWQLPTGRATPAAGPHLQPYVPAGADYDRLFGLPPENRIAQFIQSSGGFWPPVPIVVVGHFDDPKAADCYPNARQKCLDRFVIDRIVVFDPSSVPAPTPSPTPTPFPFADPPPALFSDEDCYHGVAKSFTGWTTSAELNIQVEHQGYVYAMVTRDVIPIGEWYDNPNYPGHKTRWWARGVCLSQEEGIMDFPPVNGTSFLEVDDGRRIAGQAP